MDRPTTLHPLRIGTRGSPLALAQAHETKRRLMAAHDLPADTIAIEVITTTGDRLLDRKLGDIGGKGLFTKEIEEALLGGGIDLAVHSMKDVPTVQPAGLAMVCLLPREDPRDAFISLKAQTLADLPAGARIGTASLRRRAQVLNRRPDLEVVLFRGNVQTRLRKLAEGAADATFLAMAGLNRLERTDVISTIIETAEMLPAVGQGAIGIETRTDDTRTRDLLAPLDCAQTGLMLAAERAFLAALDGSCRTPLAGLARLVDDRLVFEGEILRPDGSGRLTASREGPAADGAAMGRDAGLELKSRGGPGYMESA